MQGEARWTKDETRLQRQIQKVGRHARHPIIGRLNIPPVPGTRNYGVRTAKLHTYNYSFIARHRRPFSIILKATTVNAKSPRAAVIQSLALVKNYG
jgi:hypothetical protein